MIREQIAAVRAELERRPAGLVAHVERVLREARPLARAWDIDPLRVELAVWGHDLFRAHGDDDQLRLAEAYAITITATDRESPVLLHGPIAAATMEREFGVGDAEVLAAVRDHTFGSPRPNSIARVVLLADKFETNKRRNVRQLRAIRDAARLDLDLALLCWADWKWVQERSNGWSSHPAHWEARLEWVHAHHAERAAAVRVAN